MSQIYYTHDNGARPFRVEISTENHVNVFIQNEEVPTYEYDPLTIFRGDSPETPMTLFSGGYGEDFDGNSFLFELADLNYIFVGDTVKSFTAHAKIITYVSLVGNNDVPYPHAIDEENRYYLMMEETVISNSDIIGHLEPTQWFFTAQLISEDIGTTPPTQPLFGVFQDIKRLCFGDDEYTFVWHPSPAEDYERIQQDFSEDIAVLKIDGERIPLSKNEYITINDEFSILHGFTQMGNINIIHERLE